MVARLGVEVGGGAVQTTARGGGSPVGPSMDWAGALALGVLALPQMCERWSATFFVAIAIIWGRGGTNHRSGRGPAETLGEKITTEARKH